MGRARASRRPQALPEEAADWLVSARAPSEAQRVFKAAVGAGSTTSSTLGPGLVEIGAFSNAMRTASAFFRILSDNGFARLPLETRVGLITSSPTASTVAEGAAIPVSRVVFNNITLAPIRVSELIVLTDCYCSTLVRARRPLSVANFRVCWRLASTLRSSLRSPMG